MYHLRRVECATCGIRVERVPRAAHDSRFTLAFEELGAFLARKRTAAIAMMVFLRMNNLTPTFTEDELVALTVRVASGQASKAEAAVEIAARFGWAVIPSTGAWQRSSRI